MMRTLQRGTPARAGLAGLIALAGVACALFPDSQPASLDDALVASITGSSEAQNSFAPGSGGGVPEWMPAGRAAPGGGPMGGAGPGGGLCGRGGFGMMGGGLGEAFLGGGFGPGFGNRPFGDATCTYSAATGRVICDPVTRSGLTIQRSMAYTDAAGQVQSAFDSATTNTINTHITATGTVVFDGRGRHGFGPGWPSGTGTTVDTATVNNTSDRTVSGLAPGSAQRTVNGWSVGREDSRGSNDQGQFTATRIGGDTTTGVVIPIVDGRPSYPTAGTVTRSMKVTLTYAGQEPKTSTRREVITYDGSNVAKLVITQDGETKTCTLPLPHGRPTCS